METFGLLGFVFGLSAFTMVNQLTKEVKSLQRQIEEVKERLPPAQNF